MKRRQRIGALVAMLTMVCTSVGLSGIVSAGADGITPSTVVTDNSVVTTNLFEEATISDKNYIYNQFSHSGTIGDYIASVANGSNTTVNGMANMPIATDDESKAASYAGAKLTLSGSTTLDMGVVDLSESKATDENPVIGFLPSVNYLGPKAPEDSLNPYVGISYTFRSTVNPDKYFDIAMREVGGKYNVSSLGVSYNGNTQHHGQGNPNTPGRYYSLEAGDPIGGYGYRFDGSLATEVSDKASVMQGRIIAKNKTVADYCYNYPVQVYYDYETSKFFIGAIDYLQFAAYTADDQAGNYHLTADDGNYRFLLLDASQPTSQNGYSGDTTKKYNSNYAWSGFTAEEAKSVAVTMHVDWNPEYTGSHDIVITDFAGQQVGETTAETLKANKGKSGILKSFAPSSDTFKFNDGHKVMLSDNDVFTKLVSFEVYPQHTSGVKAVNNSGIFSIAMKLTDGTDSLVINLKDFSEADGDGNPLTYRSCYSVSVNNEPQWGISQNAVFSKGEYTYPIPYHFDRSIRYPITSLVDQYYTGEAGSSNVIRDDNKGVSCATFNLYYNAADNSIYTDVGRDNTACYTVFEKDGTSYRRWKVADLSSIYDGQRTAFEGFGDKLLDFSMQTVLTSNKAVKIRILEVDGQTLATDEDGKIALANNETSKAFAPSDGLVAAGENVAVPAPFKHNVLSGKITLDTNEYTVSITDPKGKVYKNVEQNKFDFTQVGEYQIEYFIDGESVGISKFTTAAVVGGELSAVTAFNVKENIAKGDVLSFEDLSVVCGNNALPLNGADIIISKNGTVVSTDENVTDSWTSSALENGVYEVCVKSENFVVTKEIEVKTSIKASATVENGTIKVNGIESSAILLEGNNTIQIIAGEGYQLDTFVIAGSDVTAEVVNGYYTFTAQAVSDNVYYTATFKKLTYTITFMAEGQVVATKDGVEYGTLFKDVTAPEIPAKAGYQTKGWSLDGDSEIKSDVTVNAVYGLATYTITFDVAGGSEIAPKEYTAGEVVIAFEEEPVKEGYVFEGWYIGETKFVFGNTLTEDITLTAKWTAKVASGDSSTDTNSSTNGGAGVLAGCMGSASASSLIVGFVALAACFAIRRKNDEE